MQVGAERLAIPGFTAGQRGVNHCRAGKWEASLPGPRKVGRSSQHCDSPTLRNQWLCPPNLLPLNPGDPGFCAQALSPSHGRGSAVPSLDGFRDFAYMPS